MIRSIIVPLTLIFISAYFSYFEILSIGQLISQSKHEKLINNFFRESQFMTSSDRVKQLTHILAKLNNTKTPLFDSSIKYESGKLKLILGLETANIDAKFNTLCDAREEFKSATSLNPRKTNYQLSLADIESISPYLARSCDQNKGQSEPTISLLERLNWIENLAPLDPPTLYQKGLIEKAVGLRLAAMTSFRKFDETSLISSEAHRAYLISLVHNEEELTTLIPVKYPNTLNWLFDFKRLGNTNIEHDKIFEKKLVELVDRLTSIENNQRTNPPEIINNLLNMYWSENTQTYEQLRIKLAKSLFRYLSLNSNNRFETEYFRILSLSNRTKLNITTQFSNISKKTGKSFNWMNGSSKDKVSVDLRSEGFGLYLNSLARNNLLVIQGLKGEQFPEQLVPEIWVSNDNNSYSQIKALDSKFTTGSIDSIPTAYLELGNLQNKYVKVFFNYTSEHAYRISGPLHRILQVYDKNAQ